MFIDKDGKYVAARIGPTWGMARGGVFIDEDGNKDRASMIR